MVAEKENKNIVIPRWVYTLVVVVVGIITSTVYAMNFLDNRYATKADVAAVTANVATKADVAAVKQTADDTQRHVLNIEQVIMEGKK